MNIWLARLDRWLDARGEIIFLRRTVGTANQSFVQCELPARIKPLTVEQLIGNITQQNFFIILSPTHIIRQQWPGGKPPPPTGDIINPIDPRIPNTTDELILRGMKKVVKRCSAIFDSGACIRIELTVLG